MRKSDTVQFGFTPRNNNWTSLRLINIFRVGLAAILFSQSFLPHSPLLNIQNLTLYAWTSFGYLLLALVLMLATWIERRYFEHQISIQIYIDIITIILLMHACGGISSGLGMLLIIAIAVTGLMGQESLATIFASLASVGVLAEYLYRNELNFGTGSSTQVGLLGIALFATALVTQTLSKRIRSGEALIQKQKLDVANLQALNAEILQNMHSGVIALDSDDRVRHINDAARELLLERFERFQADTVTPFALKALLPNIDRAMQDWRETPELSTSLLTYEQGRNDIQISFHNLHGKAHHGTLIFLDDVSRLKTKMQQAKLASLGKLSANIAHEIRNPLTAISQAAELLTENDQLGTGDQRLCQIIRQHTRRINDIIEDIMSISRGHVAAQQEIALKPWLERFIENFCISIASTRDCFELDIEDESLQLRFDTGHLTRILTNLCQNARAHGNADLPVTLKVIHNDDDSVCLEVADQGPGIDEQAQDKIFEPFYTTSHQGSGLGLYIVSQLCELNDAHISVKTNDKGGASFTLCK